MSGETCSATLKPAGRARIAGSGAAGWPRCNLRRHSGRQTANPGYSIYMSAPRRPAECVPIRRAVVRSAGRGAARRRICPSLPGGPAFLLLRALHAGASGLARGPGVRRADEPVPAVLDNQAPRDGRRPVTPPASAPLWRRCDHAVDPVRQRSACQRPGPLCRSRLADVSLCRKTPGHLVPRV